MLIKDDVCVCDQCGKRWLPESDKMPLRCSRCKSSKWNSGRPVPEPTAAPAAPDAPQEPAAEPHKEPKAKRQRKASRPPTPAGRRKARNKVQAISAPATQASQMTTRSQLMPTAHAVNCACYSCHTPDW